MTSQAPAWRSRVSPSCRFGRTTRSDGTAVILTIAASAEAEARKARCAFHHGGKTTATTSAPGWVCNDSPAIANQLATSNTPAFAQASHCNFGIVFPRSIIRENKGPSLMAGKCSVGKPGENANLSRGASGHSISSIEGGCDYAAGTGNAVTDLIFSIAKREVTFFSGTAPISFL
jgi:hypothetical protein